MKMSEKSSINYLKKISSYALRYKLYLILIAIFSLIESAAAVISPKVSGMAITALSAQIIDFTCIFHLVAWLCVLYSVYAFSSCLSSYFISFVTIKVTYNLREDISKKMGKLRLEYLEGTSHGDIMSRVMNDVDTLSSAFTQSVNQIISSSIMAVGVMFMMFRLSWEMTLISLGIIPLIAVVIIIILKKSQKYFVIYQENLGKINGFISETFSGHEIISAFEAQEKFEEKFETFNELMYDSSRKSQFLSGMMSPLIDMASKISYILACVMGGYLAATRGFAIGDISAFIAYSGQFMHPIIQIAGMSNLFQQTMASAKRVFEFLEAPEESPGPSDSILPECINGIPQIEFRNVSFGYNKGKTIIDNFSLKIFAGQTVAIVGETGAGKTTLLKLLMRFYEASDGEILWNGTNIKAFGINNYRNLFGVVTQDAWLYKATIADNIKYGDLTATIEQIKEVAQYVGISHFAESLSSGYDTVIEEDSSNISEGQRQLICIARMVLRDPCVFIMDEATSSVDTFTESQIQEAIGKATNNKTALIIAHRLSTIKNADMIVVLENGKLAEAGNHEELLKYGGLYSELYFSQFEKRQ